MLVTTVTVLPDDAMRELSAGTGAEVRRGHPCRESRPVALPGPDRPMAQRFVPVTSAASATTVVVSTSTNPASFRYPTHVVIDTGRSWNRSRNRNAFLAKRYQPAGPRPT